MVSSSCTDDGNECQNGGVCILVTDQSDGNKTPANYCQCPKGTSGDICHGVDVCPLNCQHGSSCRHYDDITHGVGGDDNDNDETGFFCECPVGNNYKGKLCNIPFTTCPNTYSVDNDTNVQTSLQCLYGGECKLDDDDDGDGLESYHCSCPKGRSGNVCQDGTSSDIQDYNGSCLADSDCGEQGLCIHKHDAKTTEETGMTTKNTYCQCSNGYGGENCELNCDSLRCQHGSSCRFNNAADDVTHANDKSDGGAYCDCGNTGIDGTNDGKYKGLECEIEVQVCPGVDGGGSSSSGTNNEQTMECLYGGSCVGSQDDTDGNFYNCDCPTNRMGTHCEIFNAKKANSGITNNNKNNIIQNNNDVFTLSQEQQIPTNVIVYGCFVIFFAIVIIVLGLMMYTKSKRRKQNLESQRAVTESLDDTFNGHGNDDKEEGHEKNNQDLDGGIVDDGFYESNGGGGGSGNSDNDDDIVNVNLDDEEPPHPKAEIV